MFTGIVATTGTVDELTLIESEWRLRISAGKLGLKDVRVGDSIAVSGCCLTVVALHDQAFSADVSRETMRCTTLGDLKTNSRVNLEKAMLAGSRFGGHIVSGHVDGVGELQNSARQGQSVRLEFAAPKELAHYIAAKGSICIDGTSLTVNEVSGHIFAVNVIPHTLKETVIGEYKPGQQVNLEVDLIARYLERLMQGESASRDEKATISREFLQEHGFKSS